MKLGINEETQNGRDEEHFVDQAAEDSPAVIIRKTSQSGKTSIEDQLKKIRDSLKHSPTNEKLDLPPQTQQKPKIDIEKKPGLRSLHASEKDMKYESAEVIGKRIAQTNRIEAVLEEVKRGEKKLRDAERKEKVFKLKNFYKATAIGLTLTAALLSIKKSAGKQHIEYPQSDNTTTPLVTKSGIGYPAQAQPVNTHPTIIQKTGVEHPVHQEHDMRSALMEKTGCDIVGIAEKNGFKVVLEVDNGDGQYVVHIGQRHFRPENADDTSELLHVIRIQKDIEGIITSLPYEPGQAPILFDEGVVDDVSLPHIFEVHRNSVDAITPSRGAFINVLHAYEHNNSRGTIHFYQDTPGANTCNHIYKTKLKELLSFYQSHPGMYHPVNVDGQVFTSAEQEYNYASGHITNRFDSFGEDSVYIDGAGRKLASENRVRLLGSETKQANDAAGVVVDEMLQSGIIGNFIHGQKLEALEGKVVFEDRENIALQLIVQHHLHQRIIPLQYGMAHDFGNNIHSFNATHPGERMGLIKLEPINP